MPTAGSGAGGGALLDLRGAWHPCAFAAGGGAVIANDIVLGGAPQEEGARGPGGPARALLLTGPNMGGKSTLLRTACVSVILAQVGPRP